MRHSVRWNILLSSLAVSLTAILVVGVVTLLLLNSYFTRQEEQYLRERGADLILPLEAALAFGGNRSELQQIASFAYVLFQIKKVLLEPAAIDLTNVLDISVPNGPTGSFAPACSPEECSLLQGLAGFHEPENINAVKLATCSTGTSFGDDEESRGTVGNIRHRWPIIAAFAAAHQAEND